MATRFDLQDTIAAVASGRGGAARGLVRLSGPRAWELATAAFRPAARPPDRSAPRQAVDGHLSYPDLATGLPATLYLFRAPRSYTGQDMAEVHTLGSPPLLELVLTDLVRRGARLALPGEFTARAFLNGKLDLTAAEAVLALIDSRTAQQARTACRQLAGGISRPVQALRDQLLDLLAHLEAELDFPDEEDVRFIDRQQLGDSLQRWAELLAGLLRQMTARALSHWRQRAVLVGPPNAGKSALFNALLGRDAALVSHLPGTTRDYLVGELRIGDTCLELVDTAGIDTPRSLVQRQADAARRQLADTADLVLWCQEAAEASTTGPAGAKADQTMRDRRVLPIWTKADLVRPDRVAELAACSGGCPVSAVTGFGLDRLREALRGRLAEGPAEPAAVVPATAARCRQSVAAALQAVENAQRLAKAQAGGELLAFELRLALDELGQIVGAVYTDDILDRIFDRFCIGK